MDKLQQTIDEATVIPPEDYEDYENDFETFFDLAGFDPADENTFFHAVLVMDADTLCNDVSRLELAKRRGIRDHYHWHVVKESMYSVLIQMHGSMDAVGHREMTWRMSHLKVA